MKSNMENSDNTEARVEARKALTEAVREAVRENAGSAIVGAAQAGAALASAVGDKSLADDAFTAAIEETAIVLGLAILPGDAKFNEYAAQLEANGCVIEITVKTSVKDA